MRFDSREATTAANRPKLSIDFTFNDVEPPTATLLDPLDNGPADENATAGEVRVGLRDTFVIGLDDFALDDASVTAQALSIAKDAAPFTDYTFSFDAAADQITLTPTADNFDAGLYTITLSSGDSKIADQTGNPMPPTTLIVNIDASLPTTPVAEDDAYQTDEDTPLIADPEAGVLDNDFGGNAPGDAVLVTGPSNGTLALNPDGSFTYTPADDFHGQDSFTYVLETPLFTSNVATVTIDVASVDDAPVALDDAYEIVVDETLIVTEASRAAALRFDPVALWRLDETSGGLALNAGSVGSAIDGTYEGLSADDLSEPALATTTSGDSAARFNGVDARVKVSDHRALNAGAGPYVDKTIHLYFRADDVHLDSEQVLYEQGAETRGLVIYLRAGKLFVGGFNRPNDDGVTTPWVASGGDADGRVFVSTVDPLTSDTVYHVALVMQGSTTGTNGTITGYLNGTMFAQKSGVGQLFDHGGAIAIGAVRDSTAFTTSSFRGDGRHFAGTIDEVAHHNVALSAEQIQQIVAGSGVLANDIDGDGDSLTAVLVDSPQNGTLEFDDDGTFLYTPTAGFAGVDSFTYVANDGQSTSNEATVTIKVNAPPIATDDAYEVNDNTSLVIEPQFGVLSNDTDANDDPLSAMLVSGPSSGTLELADDGSFTYTPDAGFADADTFTYRADDGSLRSEPATVTINVLGVAPVAVNDTYETSPGEAIVVGAAEGVLANDSDPQGEAMTAVVLSGPGNGTLTLETDGSFTYTPDEGFSGDDVFTYRVSDPLGHSSTGTVTMVVHAVLDLGDAPSPYPTLLSDDGPAHKATGPRLGASRDDEADGQPSGAADGDGADEDGVTFGTIMVGQLDASVNVNVQNAPAGAKLDAWVDFNGDGNWGGPGEHIFDAAPVSNGDNALQFDVPSWAASGNTYARFRLSTTGDLGVGGLAADGEVEDYSVEINPPSAAIGEFGETNTISSNADRAISVFAADVDGDGDIDVLSASQNDDKIAWYENDGSGGFTAHTISTAADQATSVFAADVDGDGDIDVLSASFRDDKIAWYENDGNERFTAHTISSSADGANSVIAVDVDGDGDIDVLSASRENDKIVWYENDGGERFTAHTISTAANGPVSVFAVDMDGDGDIDVLSASRNDNKIAWYENDGGERFTAHTISTAADGAASVFAVDLNGDGDMDVLSASFRDHKVAWYESDGRGQFTEHYISTVFIGARGVSAADLDGDGDIDVLSTSPNDNKIAWYENDGSGGFTAHTITTAADSVRTAVAADVDGDGDLDVLSASADDDTVAWYENIGDPSLSAGNDDYTTLEDQLLSVSAELGVLANDSDTQERSLSAVLDVDAQHGELVLAADGSFTYLPDPDFFGTDNFSYRVGADSRLSIPAIVTIAVENVDDPPVAVDDSYTINEDVTLVATEAYAAAVVAAQPVGYWRLGEAAGSTIAEDVTGAHDGVYENFAANEFEQPGPLSGDSDTSALFDGVDNQVTVPHSPELTITGDLTVEFWMFKTEEIGIDQRLVGKGADRVRTFGVWELPSRGHRLLFQQHDGRDGRAMHVESNSRIELNRWYYIVATLKGNKAKIYIDGRLDAQGTRSRAPGVDTRPLTMGKQPDSHAFFPGRLDEVAVYDRALSAAEIEEHFRIATEQPPSVLANDVEVDGDELTATLVDDVRNGILTLSPDGSFTYTPNADFFGTDTFTYSVNDGTTDSNSATATITVVSLNDPPVADDDGGYELAEDGALVVDADAGVLVGDSDVEGDQLTAQLFGDAQHGVVSLAPDGSFSYTPDANFFGEDSFTYTANDGGIDSVPATVTITVKPIDDAPVAVDDVFEMESGKTLTMSAGVLANDFDADGDPLTATLVDGVEDGTLEFNADGTFAYTPVENFIGVEQFTYRASDGENLSNLATVFIEVEGWPVAVDDEYEMDENQTLVVESADGVLGNDSDLDSDTITAILTSSPQHGTLSLSSDGAFTYTPNAGFIGHDSFTYRPSDGEHDGERARVTIAVGMTVDVALVARVQPSSEDTLGELPASLSEIAAGTSYFVEVWVQDIDEPGLGISGGTVDLGYDTAPADVTALSHGSLFNFLTTGEIDDTTGLVDDFGGGTFEAAVGIAPTWARLGYVEVSATAAGPVTFTLSEGQSAFSRSGLGNVPWIKVDLSSTLTVDQVGGLVLFDMTVVRQPTNVDALGQTKTLAKDAEFLHEWESYWVEVWLSTPDDDGIGIAGGTVDLAYDTSRFTATQIKYGAAFPDQISGTIDDAAGLIRNLGALTTRGGIGDADHALLARVRFEPTAADEAEVDVAGQSIGPYDLGLGLSNLQFPGVETRISPAPETPVWAVFYDVDDSGLIDLGDFSRFAPTFGLAVDGAEPIVWWADFDKSGLVDFGDFSFFVANVNRSKPDAFVSFPENYPDAWLPGPRADTPGAAAGTPIRVELVAVPTPRDVERVAQLPETLREVASGQTFYIEVWLRDLFNNAQGITGGMVDLLFNSTKASAIEVQNSDQFGVFSDGVIKAADGLIDRLGGGTFSSGVGAEDEWALLATVQYTATTDGQMDFSLGEGDLQLSRFNLGNVSWDDVELGSLTLNASPISPADLTGNGFVDFQDLTVLLANWNQNVSAAEGNLVDEGTTPVNFQDLTVLLAAWTGPGGAASPQAAVRSDRLQPVESDRMNPVTTSTSGRRAASHDSDAAVMLKHNLRAERRGDVGFRPAGGTDGRLQAAAVDRAMGEGFALEREMIVGRRARRAGRR